MRARFGGAVVNLSNALQIGTWVACGERLAQITSPEGIRIGAYVEEAAAPRIGVGTHARFIADEQGFARVDCLVESIDRIALTDLEHLALASPYGGPIPAKPDGSGVAQPHDARRTTHDAHFRVRLGQCSSMPGAQHEHTGSAVIQRERGL